MSRWLGGTLVTGLLVAGLAAAEVVPPGKPAPELAGGAWINSEPLSMQKLRGRVVLIDFWTYG
jgi:hypothetical protein